MCVFYVSLVCSQQDSLVAWKLDVILRRPLLILHAFAFNVSHLMSQVAYSCIWSFMILYAYAEGVLEVA